MDIQIKSNNNYKYNYSPEMANLTGERNTHRNNNNLNNKYNIRQYQSRLLLAQML